MKKRRRPQMIQAECRRGCGATLHTLDRSLYGLDEIRKKYYLICAECLTPDEKEEMLNAMSNGILQKIS